MRYDKLDPSLMFSFPRVSSCVCQCGSKIGKYSLKMLEGIGMVGQYTGQQHVKVSIWQSMLWLQQVNWPKWKTKVFVEGENGIEFLPGINGRIIKCLKKYYNLYDRINDLERLVSLFLISWILNYITLYNRDWPTALTTTSGCRPWPLYDHNFDHLVDSRYEKCPSKKQAWIKLSSKVYFRSFSLP